ncbi:MAG: PIN domain-containing protein [Candidatus Riflebacteria bacterium]|nr:PIN domain-containing protein [Candidatus Riflebacteria bacterium]
MRVFFDTSGFFAILVRNDCMHVRARETFEYLVEQKAALFTTSYVLLETTALLQARVGLEAAQRFQHEFATILKIHWVDERLHEKAFRRLELRGRREISLVDCASFVYMEDTGIAHVFAYDNHFSDEGFVVFGTAKDVKRCQSDKFPKP